MKPRRGNATDAPQSTIPVNEWFHTYVWNKWPHGSFTDAYERFTEAVSVTEAWDRRSAIGKRIAFELGRYAETMANVPRGIPVDCAEFIRTRRWGTAVEVCPEFVDVWLACMRAQDAGEVKTDREAAHFFGQYTDGTLKGQMCLETEAFLLADGAKRGTLDKPWTGMVPGPVSSARQEVIEAAQAVGQF